MSQHQPLARVKMSVFVSGAIVDEGGTFEHAFIVAGKAAVDPEREAQETHSPSF